MQKNTEIQNELLTISKTIASIPMGNMYSLPDNYFEELRHIVMDNINKMSTTPLDLNNKSTDVYEIPMNYFDSLPDQIMFKIKNEKKVVVIKRHSFLIKLSIAAVAIVLLGISITPMLKRNRFDEENKNYSAYVIQEARSILTNKNFDEKLNNLNDKDIVDYLQEDGLDVNAALVASLSDEKEILMKEDDFYDGETLDNYLRELKIEETKMEK